METREDNQRATVSNSERPGCSSLILDGVSSNDQRNFDSSILHSHHHHHHFHSAPRNIEIDWREMDPYFSELSDCASFWTLINFTCDVIYSGLFVLFFIMGQDVESMFFEGLLNHINPILVYLILSLVVNYGALRSLRSGREKCFLMFSVAKLLLFPVTISLFFYLVFCDVRDYFGTFWVSFVVIVGCYNLTAVLGLWSMFTCNKYILVNEAAQKRTRKQAKQQRDCQFGCALTSVSYISSTNCQRASTSRTCSSHLRKVGDSSCANSIILVCKPDDNSINPTKNSGNKSIQPGYHLESSSSTKGQIPTNSTCVAGNTDELKPRHAFPPEDVSSYGEEDEVLQISTIHKVMQEIRLLDGTTNDSSLHKINDKDCESTKTENSDK